MSLVHPFETNNKHQKGLIYDSKSIMVLLISEERETAHYQKVENYGGCTYSTNILLCIFGYSLADG